MRATLRILAIALLALAVPVQGMAAIAAGQCMALGHHGEGAAQDQHGHDEPAADGHDHATHSHGDAADDADNAGSASHCGPCTACCASASISSAAALPILPSQSHAKYVFFQFSPRGVQPHGLDRPPLAL